MVRKKIFRENREADVPKHGGGVKTRLGIARREAHYLH